MSETFLLNTSNGFHLFQSFLYSPKFTHHFLFTTLNSPLIIHQSPITKHSSPITDHQSLIINHHLGSSLIDFFWFLICCSSVEKIGRLVHAQRGLGWGWRLGRRTFFLVVLLPVLLDYVHIIFSGVVCVIHFLNYCLFYLALNNSLESDLFLGHHKGDLYTRKLPSLIRE